jgi:Holliday junction resolvase RusA-like endonuclease
LALERPAYIVLPVPISTNNLFRNVEKIGRVATSDYKAWQKNAAQRLAAQRPLPAFALPVDIVLLVGEKGVGEMDSDNAAKAFLDALVKAKVIRNDSKKWVRSCKSQWVPGIAGCVACIRPAQQPPTASDVLRAVRPGLRGLLT